jgi:hypothetical protein
MTPDEPSNIVALNADAAKDLEIRQRNQQNKYDCPGLHRSIEVDSVTRTVTCTACGFVVDPFDYLLHWARDGERRMQGLKTIQIKTKICQAEYDDLTRKIKNLRQQLKRAGQPQPVTERQQYDSQPLERRNLKTVYSRCSEL